MPSMLPIPILIALLAQAEPAPADATAQTEAEPAPATEQTAGAEAEPAPPAPATPPPPMPETAPPATPDDDPHMLLGFRAGADFQHSGDVTPKVGYSFSPFFQYDYARLADRLGLGVRAEFTFDRFQKQVTALVIVDGVEQQYRTTRALTYFDFALLATATLKIARLQPWIAAGAGVALANFQTAETEFGSGDSRKTRLLVLGAGGLDLNVGRRTLVGIHFEYRAMLATPDYALTDGTKIEVFGDRMSIQAALSYQF